jgi:hypothetical protein
MHTKTFITTFITQSSINCFTLLNILAHCHIFYSGETRTVIQILIRIGSICYYILGPNYFLFPWYFANWNNSSCIISYWKCRSHFNWESWHETIFTNIHSGTESVIETKSHSLACCLLSKYMTKCILIASKSQNSKHQILDKMLCLGDDHNNPKDCL